MRDAISILVLGLCGALAACGGSSSSGGAGGATGTGGGGTAGAETSINDCTLDQAEDHTGDAELVITTPGLAYSPPCSKVKAGTKVTWNSDFATHPLVGGEIADDSTKTPDPASPIPATSTGTTASVTFPSAGAFGFYCDVHGPGGMKGAVFVVK